MKRFIKTNLHNDSGEIMLESSFVMISVFLMLTVMLSLNFMFYQQSMITSVAAEISSSVAKNYKYTDTDLKTSEFTVSDASSIRKYRLTLNTGKMMREHEEQADTYGVERIELTTLGINSSDVDVTCQLVHTGIGRAYVKVTVTNKTDFFLSNVLEAFGIYDGNGFSSTSYAECTDMTGYASTVNFSNYTADVLSPLSGVGKIYSNFKSIIDKLKD